MFASIELAYKHVKQFAVNHTTPDHTGRAGTWNLASSGCCGRSPLLRLARALRCDHFDLSASTTWGPFITILGLFVSTIVYSETLG